MGWALSKVAILRRLRFRAFGGLLVPQVRPVLSELVPTVHRQGISKRIRSINHTPEFFHLPSSSTETVFVCLCVPQPWYHNGAGASSLSSTSNECSHIILDYVVALLTSPPRMPLPLGWFWVFWLVCRLDFGSVANISHFFRLRRKRKRRKVSVVKAVKSNKNMGTLNTPL